METKGRTWQGKLYLRAGLHHGPWSGTMEDGLFFMVQVLNKINLQSFWGPLTRCNPNVNQEKWPCIKKLMCWFIFLYYMPKKGILEKNSSLIILLSSLGLHLSSLLVECVEDVACSSSHNNFYQKKMSNLLCTSSMFFTCDKYLMLYIEHYLQPTSPCVLKFLSSRCPTSFGETCGSMFKG